ncbi:MAG TPA: hypothetical protein VMB71_10270 [Acetobacteraceae bacterium]|nr:hypothetical protein [Acetobacteraceae bacterium]
MGTPTTDANGTTQLVSMPHATGDAMYFIPTAGAITQIPLMVYYHGHANNDKKLHTSILEYIAALAVRDFRPLLKTKKCALIEPFGGTYSKFGAPATAAGLAALIDAALGKTTRPGSLILAGFSGGGDALAAVGLNLSGPLFAQLSEVWCLDCMYSGEGKKWGDWARRNNKRLRVGLSTGENSRPGRGPRAQKDAIGTGGTITIETVDCGHEELPGICLQNWLGTP